MSVKTEFQGMNWSRFVDVLSKTKAGRLGIQQHVVHCVLRYSLGVLSSRAVGSREGVGSHRQLC